jgi:hypothetical protein
MPIADTPGTWNPTIYAGQDWKPSLGPVTIGTAVVDLTGYTPAMKMRESYTAGSAIATLGTAEITLGGTAGTIDIDYPAAQTAALGSALGYGGGSLVYDLELTSGGGEVTRLLMGVISISPEATR